MNFRELPEITERQKEIMDLVYRFRFINRAQIQRLFNHKDARRINTWLKDLVEKKYLGRIYSHKLLENTKPAIYYLQNNGIIWVRYEKGEEYSADYGQLDMKYLKKFYEDKNASQTFINHSTTLFEFYIQFKEYERKFNDKKGKDILEYSFWTKTEKWIYKKLHPFHNEDFDEIKGYIPDLAFEKIKNPDEESIDSSTFFLELFDPKIPRYAIKYRVKQYIKFKEEGKWKYETGIDRKFPTILLIFPNQQKLNFLSGYIRDELERSYESEGLIFQLTTYQKAMTETLLGGQKIWKTIMEE